MTKLEELLFNAIENHDITRVSKLITQGVDVNAKNCLGDTVLIVACKKYAEPCNFKYKHDYLLIAQTLIEAGADIDVKNREGSPLLSFITAHSCIDLIDKFIAAKVNINAKDTNGQTAIYAAPYCGLLVFKRLLRAGIDVNSQDINGRTIMDHLVEFNAVAFIDTLLVAQDNNK